MNRSSSSWTGRAPRSMQSGINPYCDDRLQPMPERSKLAEFFIVYRAYRASHPKRYAARVAFQIAFRGRPF